MKSDDFYPTYKLKIHEILKGESIPDDLQVNNFRLRFDAIVYPNPFYRVKENVRRMFLISKISNLGVVSVNTSRCTPFLSKLKVIKALRNKN